MAYYIQLIATHGPAFPIFLFLDYLGDCLDHAAEPVDTVIKV